MLKVALTGGAGSGKSTVARFFQAAGVSVIDVDELAREVVEPGQPASEALRQAWGPEFFRPDGRLNRQELARRVFSQPSARQRLNALVHPYITREIQKRLRLLEARGEPLVIVEVPLLFELGLDSNYDRVIVVYADRETQIRRLQDRDRREHAQIEGILKAQEPLEDKLKRAHYVIDNRGSCQETQKQVKFILKKINQNLLDKSL